MQIRKDAGIGPDTNDNNNTFPYLYEEYLHIPLLG